MAISAKDVKELRDRTGAGMMECKAALQEADGDMERAIDLLRARGAAKAAKRSAREASEGVIASYIHMGGRIGVLVEVGCETDFVARTDQFQQLVRDVAMHIAALSPIHLHRDEVSEETVAAERRIAEETAREEGKPEQAIPKIVEGRVGAFYKDFVLLEQPSITEPKRTVQQVIADAGLTVDRFARFEVGQA